MPPPPSENSTARDTATPAQSPDAGSTPTSTPAGVTSPSPSTTTTASPSDRCTTSAPETFQRTLPLEVIEQDPSSTNRINPNPERITELARSIAISGLINPITVRKTHGAYVLIAGVGRLAAVRSLGWTEIPVTVIIASDVQSSTIRLSENVARSNLSPVEEATQLAHLVEQNPNGVDGVATAIGRAQSWILDRLEIMDWPDALAQQVHEKRISLAAAKRLAKIQPDELRLQRIADAAHHGINAATAALWLQASRWSPAEQPNSQTPPPVDVVPRYTTTTRVNCFVCRNDTPLERSHPVRICDPCLHAIHAKTVDQPMPADPTIAPQRPLSQNSSVCP